MQVGIVEVGYGNIPSLMRVLTNAGFDVGIVDSPNDFSGCDRLILPGVGAFPNAMQNLRETGLADAIKYFAEVEKKPLLGICLGAQLLFESSEEEKHTLGLGILEGRVLSLTNVLFPSKIPHTGWSDTYFVRELGAFHKHAKIPFFYNHSFFFSSNQNDVVCDLESNPRVATGILRKNILALQFHPEKSLDQGLYLLKTFLGDGFVRN